MSGVTLVTLQVENFMVNVPEVARLFLWAAGSSVRAGGGRCRSGAG
jgi:hypothetical protein